MVGETQNAPQEIIDLFSYYRETQAALEEEEQEMAAGIATEIQKASEIEGVVDVRISDGHRKEDLEVDDIQAFGYKKYSFTLSAKLKEYNKPQRFETVKMFKIRSLLKTLYNRIVKWSSKKIYSSLIILSTPKSIQSAIAKFVKEKIIPVSEIFWCPKPAHNKYLKIRFSYRYNRDGLRITLINMVCNARHNDGESGDELFIANDFPGYTRKELKKIANVNAKLRLWVAENQDTMYSDAIRKSLNDRFPELFRADDYYWIKSPQADKELKWYLVEKFCEKDHKYVETFNKVIAYRKFWAEHFKTLRSIQQLAANLQERSKKWKMELHFPDILKEENHLVSFDMLHPVHLLRNFEGEKNRQAGSDNSAPGHPNRARSSVSPVKTPAANQRPWKR